MRLKFWPYFFRQALININNNRIVHFISLGTMVVSILIFSIFLLMFVNINMWIEGWGHSLSMSVYLQDGIEKEDHEKIAFHIRSLQGAEIKHFISKKQAFKDLKDALGPEAGFLKILSKNPLPASFEVVFKNVGGLRSDSQKIKKELENIDGVEEVQYSEEWLKRFEGLMNMIRIVGVIVGGLLFIGILFIIINTIKLTIYSRKEEIEILKLVGATDWFVRIPFLLEGVIQGISSGILAVISLFSVYLFLSTKKMHFLGLGVLEFVFIPCEYTLSIFLISIGLGLGGSFIAVRRFFEI